MFRLPLFLWLCSDEREKGVDELGVKMLSALLADIRQRTLLGPLFLVRANARQRIYDIDADLRMHLNDLPLIISERAWLVQDALRYSGFADIMQNA
jgi:hypothetical protein